MSNYKETDENLNNGNTAADPALQAELSEEEKTSREEEVDVRESWEQNRTGKKNGKKFQKKDYIRVALVAVAVIAALIFVSRFIEEDSKRTVPEAGRQYYAGAEAVFDEKTQITKNDKGEAVRTEDGETQLIANLPIYYDGRDALMITQDVLFYDPRTDRYVKVDQFSEISRDDGGNIVAKKDRKSQRLGFGFLYNGDNIYVLLEPMVLKLNGYTMELPALSYIDADYQNGVQIFNYDTKETELVPVKDEVELSAGEAYTVLTITDAVILPDGSRELLFGAPELVDSIYAD